MTADRPLAGTIFKKKLVVQSLGNTQMIHKGMCMQSEVQQYNWRAEAKWSTK